MSPVRCQVLTHIDIIEKTHSYSYQYALENFEYLTNDRRIQRITFGDMDIVANFRREKVEIGGVQIPARSVLISFPNSEEFLVYPDPALSEALKEKPDMTFTS